MYAHDSLAAEWQYISPGVARREKQPCEAAPDRRVSGGYDHVDACSSRR